MMQHFRHFSSLSKYLILQNIKIKQGGTQSDKQVWSGNELVRNPGGDPEGRGCCVTGQTHEKLPTHENKILFVAD